MLAAGLPALERADMDAGFLEALAELYPTCEAFRQSFLLRHNRV